MRRLEHGLDHDRSPRVEVPRTTGLLEAQAGISAHFAVCQRAPERLEAELPNERVRSLYNTFRDNSSVE